MNSHACKNEQERKRREGEEGKEGRPRKVKMHKAVSVAITLSSDGFMHLPKSCTHTV